MNFANLPFHRSPVRRVLFAVIISVGIGSIGCAETDGDALPLGDPESFQSAESPKDLCRELAAMSCQHLFDCFSADERAELGFPGDLGTCQQSMAEQNGCSLQAETFQCPTGTWLHPEEVRKCVEDTRTLTCREFQAGLESESCASFCQASPPQTHAEGELHYWFVKFEVEEEGALVLDTLAIMDLEENVIGWASSWITSPPDLSPEYANTMTGPADVLHGYPHHKQCLVYLPEGDPPPEGIRSPNAGGFSGTHIFELQDGLTPGTRLHVLDVGNEDCQIPGLDLSTRPSDAYDVYISQSSDGGWIHLGRGAGEGAIEIFTVPEPI